MAKRIIFSNRSIDTILYKNIYNHRKSFMKGDWLNPCRHLYIRKTCQLFVWQENVIEVCNRKSKNILTRNGRTKVWKKRASSSSSSLKENRSSNVMLRTTVHEPSWLLSKATGFSTLMTKERIMHAVLATLSSTMQVLSKASRKQEFKTQKLNDPFCCFVRTSHGKPNTSLTWRNSLGMKPWRTWWWNNHRKVTTHMIEGKELLSHKGIENKWNDKLRIVSEMELLTSK